MWGKGRRKNCTKQFCEMHRWDTHEMSRNSCAEDRKSNVTSNTVWFNWEEVALNLNDNMDTFQQTLIVSLLCTSSFSRYRGFNMVKPTRSSCMTGRTRTPRNTSLPVIMFRVYQYGCQKTFTKLHVFLMQSLSNQRVEIYFLKLRLSIGNF